MQELFAFGGEHPRDGNPRPARHHLGYVFGVDLLLDHRAARRRQLVLFFERRNLLFGLLNLAVADFGHTAVVALAFGLAGFDVEPLDFLLVVLYLAQQVALPLPLGPHRRIARAELLDLLGQPFDALFVLFAADGFALDFQLAHPAVEGVDLFGHRVHFQTQARSRFVH